VEIGLPPYSSPETPGYAPLCLFLAIFRPLLKQDWRLKIFWGIDDGQVYGSRRFHAHVGAVLIAHLGLATASARAERYEGTYGTMRLSPIARTLREMMKKPPQATTDPAAANG